ncbi:MAG: hypothetical protein Q4C87_06820 [Actinomycetaceae bacterium]|nr:hypothetical protein [Actinomycetaceae bacterium]
MDLWGQLIGRKDPSIVALQSENWVDIPSSPGLQTALSRRAHKEVWEVGPEVPHFVLATLRLDYLGKPASLEILSGGVPLARFTPDEVPGAIREMVNAQVTSVAAKALARYEGGTWSLKVGL